MGGALSSIGDTILPHSLQIRHCVCVREDQIGICTFEHYVHLNTNYGIAIRVHVSKQLNYGKSARL